MGSAHRAPRGGVPCRAEAPRKKYRVSRRGRGFERRHLSGVAWQQAGRSRVDAAAHVSWRHPAACGGAARRGVGQGVATPALLQPQQHHCS